MSRNKLLFVLAILVLGVLALSACAQGTPQVVEKVVTVEVTKEVEVVKEVEKEVTKEVQVEVTPTPVPMADRQCVAPRPDTITEVTFGDIETMDPNLAYDTASGQLIMNVMEPLVTYNGADATSFVPALATEVPSLENGGISADGKVYTFKLREGVKFHEGGDMTPSDAAYTFHRGMLQSDPNGPQWLLLEPILGFTSGDVTEQIAEGAYAGDRDAVLANATPE